MIAYALAAPYLYLFVPAERREDGARLLLWIWAPALLVGAMTAYTSADGFVHAAVGLLPGMVASGLFLAWGLAPLRQGRGTPWPALAGMAAVVLVTLVFQLQFQYGGAGWRDLSARMGSGPWQGIAVTSGQRDPPRPLRGGSGGEDLRRQTCSSSIRRAPPCTCTGRVRSRRTRTSCTWPTPRHLCPSPR